RTDSFDARTFTLASTTSAAGASIAAPLRPLCTARRGSDRPRRALLRPRRAFLRPHRALLRPRGAFCVRAERFYVRVARSIVGDEDFSVGCALFARTREHFTRTGTRMPLRCTDCLAADG